MLSRRSRFGTWPRSTRAVAVEYKVFPDRPHFPGVPGWEDVADYALDWAVRESGKDPDSARVFATPRSSSDTSGSPVKIVGLGGSLASGSQSRAASGVRLGRRRGGRRPDGAPRPEELDLPMYDPDGEAASDSTLRMIEVLFEADGLLSSIPLYRARSRALSRMRSTGFGYSVTANRPTSRTR